MIRFVPVLSVALFLALPATAQEPRLVERLGDELAGSVRALADSADALSLPGELVVQKALEGASKGASPAAITEALRGLIRDLELAREALGGEAKPETLHLGATAIDAGLSVAELAQLRPYRTRAGFRAALVGIIYLRSRDVPSRVAFETVESMLEADLPAAGFVSLQRLVERDVRTGIPSPEATQVRARALIRYGVPLRPDGEG